MTDLKVIYLRDSRFGGAAPLKSAGLRALPGALAKRAGLTSVPALRLTFSEPGWQSVSKERADAWENVARRDLTAAERMFREAELHEIRMRDAKDPDVATSGSAKKAGGHNAREIGIDRGALRDSVRFAKMDPKEKRRDLRGS